MSYILCIFFILLGIFGLAGCGKCIAGFLQEKDENQDIIILLSSCVLMPVTASFLLWLMLFLCPGKFTLQTLGGSVIAFYLVLAVAFGKAATQAILNVYRRYSEFWRRETPHWGSYICLFIVAAMLVFSGVLATNVPLNNFDIIEYCMGGDLFAQTRSIVYNGYFMNLRNGFIYFTYHSFCFPLFAT